MGPIYHAYSADVVVSHFTENRRVHADLEGYPVLAEDCARYEHRSMAPYVVLPRHYSSQISDPSVEFVVSNAPLFSFS